MDIITILVETEVCLSRAEARRMVGSGLVSVNDEKVTDVTHTLAVGDQVSTRKKTVRWVLPG